MDGLSIRLAKGSASTPMSVDNPRSAATACAVLDLSVTGTKRVSPNPGPLAGAAALIACSACRELLFYEGVPGRQSEHLQEQGDVCLDARIVRVERVGGVRHP